MKINIKITDKEDDLLMADGAVIVIYLGLMKTCEIIFMIQGQERWVSSRLISAPALLMEDVTLRFNFQPTPPQKKI